MESSHINLNTQNEKISPQIKINDFYLSIYQTTKLIGKQFCDKLQVSLIKTDHVKPVVLTKDIWK